MVALWPRQNTFRWTYRTGFNDASPPVVGKDGTVYFGSRRGELIAVRPDGTEKWIANFGLGMIGEVVIGPDGNLFAPWSGIGRSGGLASVSPSGATNWFFMDSGSVQSTPALGPDGTIYFGGHSSNFHALNPDGTVRWQFATQGIIESSPAVAPDGSVALVSHDMHFYLLKPDGSLTSRFKFDGHFPPRGLARAPGGNWVVGTSSSIHALHADGTHRWTTDLLSFPVPRTNQAFAPYVQGKPQFEPSGKLHVSTGNGYIYTLNEEGTVLGAIDKGLRVLPGGAADLNMTTNHGLLFAFEESFSVPLSATSFEFGTERAAVVYRAPNGEEQWRVRLTGNLDWVKLLDFSRFKVNRQRGFGVRDYQQLSRPAFGVDGTIYIRSTKGLHAIQPPGKK